MAADPSSGPPRAATVLRALTAAGVLMSADIHLVLFFEGYDTIPVIGPLFLLNAVAGLAIALALLLWRHWLPLLGAIGFGAATLLSFYLSTTVGLFGVNETLGGTQQVLAAVSEWVALVCGAAALVIERRRKAG